MTRLAGIAAAVLCGFFPSLSHAQVNVTTYHNDNARTGQNTLETTLTPLNVNSTQFGKLFSVAVDGYVYAQPLYLSNVQIQGGTHNVVYIATENDSVYAVDADNGAVYWHVNLIPAGGTAAGSIATFKCGDLVPEVGITGTPVIDINTGTLYVVAVSTVNGNVVQFLHAIDVQTSIEKFGGPVNIQASAPGTASDGNGTTVSFNPRYENQRAALLLENGHVVIAWSSFCDIDPWHGWVMSYGAGTLAQEGVLNPSANGNANGVWMSGGGPAADANGNIYVVTGNGSWNGMTDFGDSIVKLGAPDGVSFPVMDYFTPYNQATLSLDDDDVSSGGLVLLPTLASGKQLLAQMGKEGKIYLIDQNNMGKNCAVKVPACSGGDPQIVQEIPKATVGIWGSPAYWNGSLYWGGASDDTGAPDALKAFSLNANGSGLISTAPTSKSTKSFHYSAPIPSISANTSTGGILWGVDNGAFALTCKAGLNCQVLYAYDATNLANMLYNSSQAANNRDAAGSAVKFATPTIANGKVYVGNQNAVVVYGLLGTGAPAAPAPTFSPAAGSFDSQQTVALSDSVATAVIHFTTDKTTPTAASPVYSGPLQIAQTTTIQAIAVAAGYANSEVATATYTITTPPTSISVDLSTVFNVYAIFSIGTAVTNGGMDTYGYAYPANLIGSSVVWSGAAFNLGSTGTPSAVDGGTLALPAGNYSSLKLLGAAVQGNHVRQVFVVTYTDGTTDSFTQSMSDWTTPQGYAGEAKALTLPYRVRLQGSTLNGAAYVYGYSFVINSAKTLKSITLPKNRDIVILAVALSPSNPSSPMAAAPTFSPVPGTYGSSQSVTLSDTTPGAVIYYTTNGTAPTTGSAQYNAPLIVAATTTINAMAAAGGYSNSGLAAATYSISTSSGNVVNVDLAAVAKVYAIANVGSAVISGGMDTYGYAYPANLVTSSVTWSGISFTLGSSGVPSAVYGGALVLPAGNYSSLKLLGAAVQGNHVRQVFVVTYTDGTTDSFTQSMSDWTTPQGYASEAKALTLPYRVRLQGSTLNGSAYMYGYSFAINNTKTVKSVTLPNNRDIVLLAITLVP